MDSVISWIILTVACWFGIAKFLLLVIAEEERKLMESERAWGDWS